VVLEEGMLVVRISDSSSTQVQDRGVLLGKEAEVVRMEGSVVMAISAAVTGMEGMEGEVSIVAAVVSKATTASTTSMASTTTTVEVVLRALAMSGFKAEAPKVLAMVVSREVDSGRWTARAVWKLPSRNGRRARFLWRWRWRWLWQQWSPE
jgi:hypothetical protein